MRAQDLVRPYPVVSARAPMTDAVQRARATIVRSILVVDDDGRLVGVLSNTDLLRAVLPSFIEESPSMAGVLRSDESELIRLHGREKRIEELMMSSSRDAVVAADDTLVKVMSVMVRTRTPLVGVVEDGRPLGGISVHQLLDRLPPRIEPGR